MVSLRGIMGKIRNFFASATNGARAGAGAGGVRSKSWLTSVSALRGTFVIALLSVAALFSYFWTNQESNDEGNQRIRVDDSDDEDDGQLVMQVFSDDEYEERVPYSNLSTRLRTSHAI